MPVVPVVFRPRPVENVEGRRVAFFSTAPAAQEEVLRRYLEERGAAGWSLFSTHLADRAALRSDSRAPAMARVDMVVTEIKAAAIDVVAEEAAARGCRWSSWTTCRWKWLRRRPARGELAELAGDWRRLAKRFEQRS